MPAPSIQPPRLAAWLLRLCLHEVDADIVLGDLEETYQVLYHQYGPAAAHRWYWSQVLRSIPRLAYRTLYWSCAMLKNYFKIALRNFKKHKGYAFINVFGLAVGIAFCALIFLFVRDELTFDQFHEHGDQIYRVHYLRYHPDGSLKGTNPNLPIPAGPTMHAEIPEIERFVRFGPERHFVRYKDNTVRQGVLYADPSLFEVFSFPLQHGDPATALAGLNTVVLSEKAARQYFGVEDPMGKLLSIRIDEIYEDFTVTGIAQTVPGNSTIQFDVLLPFARLLTTDHFRDDLDRWDMVAFPTYVTLGEHAQEEEVNQKLRAFYEQRYPDYEQNMRESGRWDGAGPPQTFALQPLYDIHLTTASDPIYSYILSGIALAILLIACINFMTLALGRSATRGKEVGIRKVVGAQRRQLIGQFWGEAVLMSVFSLVLGLLLATGFLPVFNELAGKELYFDYAADGLTLAMLAGLVLFTGLVAGSYPALVLSGFKPVDVLKSRLRLNGSNGFTKSLVVVQFALSVFLIIGTLIMNRQLDYVRTKDLGFDQEQVVVIRTSGLDGRRVSRHFRDAVGSHAKIRGITAAGNTLGYRGSSGVRFDHEGKTHNIDLISVEADFLDVMDIDLVAGRSFDPNLATDSTETALVNEAFVKDFDMAAPLGQPIPGFPFGQAPIIVGVTPDFNYQVLYQEVGPVMLSMRNFWGFRYLFVRISPDDMPGTLETLRTTWAALTPDVPFSYFFLDEEIQGLYRSDQRWAQIIHYASLFAILIACLGLFGLASLTVTGRTKEIGIRKVLGASSTRIVTLVSKDFVRLVLIGVVLAAPVAYLAMHRWLDTFAFRVDLSWPIFLLAGLIALLVAALTVSYQAIRAALADPVKALRYE